MSGTPQSLRLHLSHAGGAAVAGALLPVKLRVVLEPFRERLKPPLARMEAGRDA